MSPTSPVESLPRSRSFRGTNAISPFKRQPLNSSEQTQKKIAEKTEEFPAFLKPILALLPFSLLQTLLASSFVNGLGQAKQEFLMQFIPKAVIGGGLRGVHGEEGSSAQNIFTENPIKKALSKFANFFKNFNWKMAADEAALELPEYAAMYIMPTAIGVSLAHLFSKFFKLDFELFGQKLNKVEKSFGKEFKFGSILPKSAHINQSNLSKLALGQLMITAITAALCAAIEVMVPSSRVLVIDKLFGSNFYEISGLTSDPSEKNSGAAAVKQAKENIKRALLFMGVAAPSMVGLTFALGKLIGNRKVGFLNKAAKIFSLSGQFGLSKIVLAICLGAALYAYPSVARNKSEELEVRDRIIRFSIPAVLFFKQFAGNIIGILTGFASGLGRVWSPLSTYWNEAFGKEAGQRDPLDFGLVNINYDKKNKSFSGKVEKLDSAQALKRENPQKYERVMKRMNFAVHDAPYWMAFFVGIAINWLNYLRTSAMYEESRNNAENMPPANNIVNFEKSTAAKPVSSS